MRCASITSVFVCSNSSGTTCTKVAANILDVNTATSCTSSEFVVLTDSEFQQYTASPFRLSVADGVTLSGLILSVWVTAWIFKTYARVIYDPQSER